MMGKNEFWFANTWLPEEKFIIWAATAHVLRKCHIPD